jgi:hypothetical protein
MSPVAGVGDSRRNKLLVYCALAFLGVVAVVYINGSRMELLGISLGGQTLPPSIDTEPEGGGDPVLPQPPSRPGAPISNTPSEEIIVHLRARLDKVEQELQKTSESNEKLLAAALEVAARLERVENAAFSDGSNAFIAVMENAFFSPTGKRWVKLCDWTNCQFQTLEEALATLFTRHIKSKKGSGNAIRAVHLVDACPRESNAYVKQLGASLGGSGLALVLSTPTSVNCTVPGASVLSQTEALDRIGDKSLDVVVFEGNGKEDSKPILLNLLKAWSVKLKTGGLGVGQDYVVTKPFNARWKPKIVATGHQTATKLAVDTFRTGDDNELGQDDTVRVAGGSLWYFVKIKPSIFG